MAHDGLAEYLADMARQLMQARTVRDAMNLIVTNAVQVVDGCDHASISYVSGRSLISAASNDDVGIMLDGIQTGADEGPCLDAIRTGTVTVANDLRSDSRWPMYGPRAAEAAGVLSSMGYPLEDGTGVIGALNLFSEEIDTFKGEEADREGTVALVVAHATPALVAALFREEIAEALARRDVIGQAKGWLMARSHVDEDEAFQILVRASQRMNVKLAEVARRMVSGEPMSGEQG